jgi:adenine phosphoribosyltransferase
MSETVVSEILAAKLIRDIPDFPKPGILFKDITPILESPEAVQQIVEIIAADAVDKGADVIVGIESRGFIFGVPIALAIKKAFVLARKPGKLPYERIREEYALEYGTNVVEMHIDSIIPGRKAYVVDDLLATGGTAGATIKLVERLGGTVVGLGCVIELDFLNGREAIAPVPVKSVLSFS